MEEDRYRNAIIGLERTTGQIVDQLAGGLNVENPENLKLHLLRVQALTGSYAARQALVEAAGRQATSSES